jgi:hypothetical protein
MAAQNLLGQWWARKLPYLCTHKAIPRVQSGRSQMREVRSRASKVQVQVKDAAADPPWERESTPSNEHALGVSRTHFQANARVVVFTQVLLTFAQPFHSPAYHKSIPATMIIHVVCGVRLGVEIMQETMEYGVWSKFMWSAEYRVSSVECGVRSVECGVWSVEHEVRSVETAVWSVDHELRSVECGVWSVDMWNIVQLPCVQLPCVQLTI